MKAENQHCAAGRSRSRLQPTEVTKVERVKAATLPPGVYTGTWIGYVVTIKMDNGEFRLSTKDGIRGTSPCVVEVDEIGRMNVVV